jgi:hypothetical protein
VRELRSRAPWCAPYGGDEVVIRVERSNGGPGRYVKSVKIDPAEWQLLKVYAFSSKWQQVKSMRSSPDKYEVCALLTTTNPEKYIGDGGLSERTIMRNGEMSNGVPVLVLIGMSEGGALTYHANHPYGLSEEAIENWGDGPATTPYVDELERKYKLHIMQYFDTDLL